MGATGTDAKSKIRIDIKDQPVWGGGEPSWYLQCISETVFLIRCDERWGFTKGNRQKLSRGKTAVLHQYPTVSGSCGLWSTFRYAFLHDVHSTAVSRSNMYVRFSKDYIRQEPHTIGTTPLPTLNFLLVSPARDCFYECLHYGVHLLHTSWISIITVSHSGRNCRDDPIRVQW